MENKIENVIYNIDNYPLVRKIYKHLLDYFGETKYKELRISSKATKEQKIKEVIKLMKMLEEMDPATKLDFQREIFRKKARDKSSEEINEEDLINYFGL